jgi:hypothetical protein
MRTRGRRRLDVIMLGLGAVTGGGIVAIGGLVGDAERVTQMWVGAELSTEGSSTVREVIDYDFGIAIDKHGIFRDIPGLSQESPVVVESDSAPDAIASRGPSTSPGSAGSNLKIGDSNTTVSGRHRYRISYSLPRSELLDPSDEISWDAVGSEWSVPVGRAEVHIVAPWEFEDLTCSKGSSGSTGGCTLRQVEPGHLVAEVDGLKAGQGITVTADRGAALSAAPDVPPPPVSAPPDPGAGLAMPAAAALTAGLGTALTTSKLVRRSGRERVGVGGVADAAWAGGGGPTSEVRLDETELAQMATTEFAPPKELTPAQGGLLLVEQVQPEHKVAWLIQAAIDGAIELVEEDKKDIKLIKKGDLSADGQGPLRTAFGGRDEIELGSYDSTFASGWAAIDAELDTWGRSSGYWDASADRRKTKVRALGALAMLVGALVAFAGGYAANRWGREWMPLIIIGSLLGGGGFAAALRGWELRVRTPQGSGLWLRVESFRRFLSESETFHAEEAAKRGVLREYTAWAVALGEIDRWERAVAGSTIIPADAGLGYVHMAPLLASSATSASTAPSSSSSSGGGGGSVGGGGGGGGGGSW